MKHLLTTAILYCIAVFTANGQNLSSPEPKTQDDILKNAAYVFDGKVIKRKSYIAANGEVYTSRIVEISKIRRGNLKIGTIEIISRYGCIPIPCKNCPGKYKEVGATVDSCIGYANKTGQFVFANDDYTEKCTYYCSKTVNNSYFQEKTSNELLEFYDNVIGISTHNHGDRQILGINTQKNEIDFEIIMAKYGLTNVQKKKYKRSRKHK
jgi:hypothetical protein